VLGTLLVLISVGIPAGLWLMDMPDRQPPIVLISAFQIVAKNAQLPKVKWPIQVDYTYRARNWGPNSRADEPGITISHGNGAPFTLLISDAVECRPVPRFVAGPEDTRQSAPAASTPIATPTAAPSPSPLPFKDATKRGYLREFALGVHYFHQHVRAFHLRSYTINADDLPVKCTLDKGPAWTSLESRTISFVQAFPLPNTPDYGLGQISPINFRLAQVGIENVRIDDNFATVSVKMYAPQATLSAYTSQPGEAALSFNQSAVTTKWEWVDRLYNHVHEFLLVLAAALLALALSCFFEVWRTWLDHPKAEKV
jgi:hypothetical protein